MEAVNHALSMKLHSGEVNVQNLPEDSSSLAQILYEHLSLLNSALLNAHNEMEPYHLTSYLFDLARHAGAAHRQLRVQGEPEDKGLPRLLLFLAIKKVLAEGMKLIGLRPLTKM